MSIASPPDMAFEAERFVGNATAQLEALKDEYELLRAEKGAEAVRTLVIHGPSGTGKTRLVQELALSILEGTKPELTEEVRNSFRIGGDPLHYQLDRKRVVLPTNVIKEMPFLWAGVSCKEGGDGTPVFAYATLRQSLRKQTAAAEARRRFATQAAKLVAGRASQLLDIATTGKDLAVGAIRLGHRAEDLHFNDLKEEFEAMLAVANHNELPGIILLDDAQYVDPVTKELLQATFGTPRHLLQTLNRATMRSRSRLLIVLTTFQEPDAEEIAELVEALGAVSLKAPEGLEPSAAAQMAGCLAVAGGYDNERAGTIAGLLQTALGDTTITPLRVQRLVDHVIRTEQESGQMPTSLAADLQSFVGEDLGYRWNRAPEDLKARIAPLWRIGTKVAPEVARAAVGIDAESVLADAASRDLMLEEQNWFSWNPEFAKILEAHYGERSDALVKPSLDALLDGLAGLVSKEDSGDL